MTNGAIISICIITGVILVIGVAGTKYLEVKLFGDEDE